MAQSHLIALPAQELSALRCAAQAPQFAALFERVPAFSAALRKPVDDELLTMAREATDAIREACGNTAYPEDWAEAKDRADRLMQQMRAQLEAQACAPSLPAPKKYGNKVCTCCGGSRIVSAQIESCAVKLLSIPHLGFDVVGALPANLGIPCTGDGLLLQVCLDCGRVVNGEYPLTDETLTVRISEYQEELL